jgi:hypothetical protein
MALKDLKSLTFDCEPDFDHCQGITKDRIDEYYQIEIREYSVIIESRYVAGMAVFRCKLVVKKVLREI